MMALSEAKAMILKASRGSKQANRSSRISEDIECTKALLPKERAAGPPDASLSETGTYLKLMM